MSLCALAVVGCQLTPGIDYTSPSSAEQNRAILEIAPYRTTRDQAVEALKREGVQGSFGVSESVYYCDVWDRGDGRHWHLDVALFFDQSGRLYKVGPSQSDVGIMNSAIDSAPSNANSSSGAQPYDGTNSTRLPASRIGRRTPFADPDGLK